MSQVKWQIIEASYGERVVGYLKHCNVIPEKTASGVYKIPNDRILTECSKLATNGYERLLQKQTTNQRKIASQAKTRISQECYDFPYNVKRVVNISVKKFKPAEYHVEHSRKPPQIAANLTICLEELYKQRNVTAELSFSRTKQHGIVWSCEKLMKQIMQRKIDRRKSIEYDDCLEEIEPVLREFQKRHDKFKYFQLLENVLSDKDSSDKKAPRVSFLQMQRYFNLIFACVIPASLFGSHRNVKKLKAGLKRYFLASWGEKISLKRHIFDMDISCITWLKPINNESTKWSIIATLVKWLFENFFVTILKLIFNVRKDLYTEAKIFLSSARWKKWKCYYIKTHEKKGSIVKKSLFSNYPTNNSVKSAPIRLIPKNKGVRCIYQLQFNESERNDITLLKVLLQQLYLQKYDCPTTHNFYSAWLVYTKRKKENANQKVYLVSADVADAYGSIIQTKLYDIVRGMINEIPHEKVPVERLAILKPNITWKKNSIEYKYWCSFCATLPRIKPGSMVTLSTAWNHPKFSIPKEKFLSLLRLYIMGQTFSFRGKQYALKRGIAQGSPLSPILSEIYYAHMTSVEFGIFMKSGTLARFVDDFLYITENEEMAKLYMKKISQGLPGYRCRFKKSKTQTNVESNGFVSSTSIMYLGYRIDCTSLEVIPVYGDSSFHHLKSMQRIYYKNEIPSFITRIMNFSMLKLSPIVLDPRINSPATILSTAELAARTMASRCVIVIFKVFDNFEQYVPWIWAEIKNAVKFLVRIFTRHLSGYHGEGRGALIRNIKISIWKSYYRVFAQRSNLRRHFCYDIKRMIMNRTVF